MRILSSSKTINDFQKRTFNNIEKKHTNITTSANKCKRNKLLKTWTCQTTSRKRSMKLYISLLNIYIKNYFYTFGERKTCHGGVKKETSVMSIILVQSKPEMSLIYIT